MYFLTIVLDELWKLVEYFFGHLTCGADNITEVQALENIGISFIDSVV